VFEGANVLIIFASECAHYEVIVISVSVLWLIMAWELHACRKKVSHPRLAIIKVGSQQIKKYQ